MTRSLPAFSIGHRQGGNFAGSRQQIAILLPEFSTPVAGVAFFFRLCFILLRYTSWKALTSANSWDRSTRETRSGRGRASPERLGAINKPMMQ